MRPGIVHFLPTRGGASVHVDILETPEERARGLMHRIELPEDEGALFWMPTRENQVFWMRNTRIPLDLIFIDRDVVVGVLTLEPMDERRRSCGRSSTTVLEVNGGWAARHGVVAGSRVAISLG